GCALRIWRHERVVRGEKREFSRGRWLGVVRGAEGDERARELAIFATYDPLVPPPADGRGRVVVVEDCGHLNLLQHPAVLHAVARFLRMTVASGAPEVGAAA